MSDHQDVTREGVSGNSILSPKATGRPFSVTSPPPKGNLRTAYTPLPDRQRTQNALASYNAPFAQHLVHNVVLVQKVA